MMKKLVSLVLALMLCLSCVSALAAEAWTVTCPWAPSGVAAMVNQKAASLSTTYSQDYVLVANAEKGDTATINSWLTKYTEADPQMCFIGEGMFGITAILDPERMNFTYDDFKYVENLYSSIFVASARKELGITSIDALKAYLEEGNQIMVGTNGATGSEAFLAAALIGAMGYGDQFYLIPYESAAEAAQAVARGEVDIAVTLNSKRLSSFAYCHFSTQRNVALLHKSHPLAKEPSVTVSQLRDDSFAIFNQDFILHEQIVDACHAAGFRPKFALLSSQWDFMVELVSKNHAVSILPKPVLDKHPDPNVCCVPMSDSMKYWDIVLTWNKEKYMPRSCQLFLDYIQQNLPEDDF